MTFELASLSTLCTRISSGGTPSRRHPEYFTSKPEHAWVKSQELRDGSIFETSEFISDAGLANSSAKYYPPDTVLVAMYGANIGQLGFLRIPATVNQAICGLVVNPLIANSRYVLYALMEGRPRLVAKAAGAAQQNLNQEAIRQFAVPAPTLATQRKIASILSAYDDLIENNTRRIKVLEEMAAAIYREWFVEFRYKGHEDALLAESEVGPVPEGWRLTTWGAVATLEYGRALRTHKDGVGPYPVFGTNGPIGWHDAPLFPTGVVVGRKGAYRGIHLADKPCWVIDTAFYLNIRETESFGRMFAYHALKTMDLNALDSGSAIPSTTRESFYAQPLVIPSQAVASSFEAMALDMRALQHSLSEAVKNLRATRDLLLPRLISGEIDVEHLDIDTSGLAA